MDPILKHNGSCHENEELLYPMEILKIIDLEKGRAKFSPSITILNPGENLKVRPLSVGDYDKGFIYLLSQLTKIGNVSHEDFLQRFFSMKGCPDTYYVTVIEDTKKNMIIGSATLLIEKKFIRQAGLRGYLEDVVVNNEYRGRQLGKLLVESMHQLAKHLGCYKITLNCKDQMIKFYSELGFILEPGNSNYMTLRFHE